MYEKYLEEGVFDNNTSSIEEIVDNDYVNWCSVVHCNDFSDEDATRLVELCKSGVRDISCEGLGYSFIEAVDDEEEPTTFLMRS